MVDAVAFEFSRISFLPILIIALVLLIPFGLFALKRKHKWLRDFSRFYGFNKLGRVQLKRSFVVLFLNLLILIFLGLLAMQPTITRSKKVPDYEKRYFSIWIDASLSALAEDIIQKTKQGTKHISRLEFEKREVLDLLKRINGDYVGLGIFAEKPYEIMPPSLIDDTTRTSQRISFEEELDKINKFGIQQMRQGSDLGAVIVAAIKSYRHPESFSGNQPKRIIIILSDGEAVGKRKRLIDNMDKALRLRSEYDDISFYIVGVGDPYNPESPDGSLIPLPNESGLPEYFKDENGREVYTKPDFDYLKQVTEESLSGSFIQARGGKELMLALENINTIEKRIVGQKTKKIKEKGSYRYIAILLFIILVLRVLIRNPIKN